MRDEFPRFEVGAESKCALCEYGVIIKTKSVPNPQEVLRWREEHPEAQDGDGPFRTLVDYQSFCANPILCGRPPACDARLMPIVLECEAYSSRRSR